MSEVGYYDVRARLRAEKEASDERRRLSKQREDEIRRLEEDQAYAAAKARLTAPAPAPAPVRAGITEKEIEALIAGFAPVVKEYVQKKIDERLEIFAGEMTREIALRVEGVNDIIRDFDKANKQHPPMRYFGIWNERTVYEAGHCVTRSGRIWYANKPNINEPPGSGQTSWTMVDKPPK